MGMHDDGEYVDAAVGYRVPGAVRDAVTFRHNLRLAWRYDVPPVGVDTDAEDAGVVGAQLVRVMQTQAGTVAYERVHLRIRVVGLEHVVARPRVRIQRVAGLGRVIEPLRKEKPWRTRSIMRRVGNVLDESGAVGFMKRLAEGTLVEDSLSTNVIFQGYFSRCFLFRTIRSMNYCLRGRVLFETMPLSRPLFIFMIFFTMLVEVVEDFWNEWRGTFDFCLNFG